ncbi:MAG TPA: type II toxin-antitoxin system VapC family toxin [Bryobacteraceae bacterium]|jgi:ribonuclease VapC|nr:type II toxin-antitoxin system VapC family toxin [Bryobacteraceae bacterium]
MVVDSSALVAILREEPGHEPFLQKALSSDRTMVGATVAFETAMVLSGRWHRDARSTLHGLLRTIGAEIVPFTEEHYEAAVSAFLRYGKGRHPAGLNFGDCMSYAFARVSGLPLLFIGDDFSKTDITPA